MLILLPENLAMETISTDELLPSWRSPYDFSACQPKGDKWYQERKSLALKVPSAVMPEAYNFVINTLHPDYKRVTLVGVTNLVPDSRIEEILKKYPKG